MRREQSIRCIECLRDCGLGGKRLSIRFGFSIKTRHLPEATDSVKKFAKEICEIGRVLRAKKAAAKKQTPNNAKTRRRWFLDEWRGAMKYDETKHWCNHPKVYAESLMHRYRTDKIFAKEHNTRVVRYRKRRIDRYRATRRKWKANRDGYSRCIDNIRSRVSKMFRSDHAVKDSTSLRLTGCTWKQLRNHIESQFVGIMSWDNYGRAWHIDHIIPCAAWDLTKADQRTACFHFSNLRPMWARANIRKGMKIVKPQMQLRLEFVA